MNWFYAKNGSQQGPLSTDEIKSRIAMGEIGPSDLAWCEGMSDWMPVGQIPQLKIEAPVREETPPPAFGAPAPSSSPYQSPASPAAAPVPGQLMPGQKQSQGLAIGSMVCGILAFIACCAWYFAGPLGLVAVILGHIAMSKIKANPVANGGKGMARTGLILGYIGLVVSILLAAFTIWFMTLSPAEKEKLLQQLPEEQRREILDKLEESRQQQQR
ncbi:MAG TPA: GYF domain-containing protein [Haloferula sp.]